MVQEILSPASWGGFRQALDYARDHWLPGSARQICIVEAATDKFLYPPAFDPELRQAAAKGQLLWVRTTEAKAPELVNLLLASGLCEGVLLHGLEKFHKSTPAGIWGRRWQLSARQGGSDFLWVHEKPVSGFLIGFDVRLEWTAPGRFEIRKGHGFVEPAHRQTARAS